jgi:hypothetical protein
VTSASPDAEADHTASHGDQSRGDAARTADFELTDVDVADAEPAVADVADAQPADVALAEPVDVVDADVDVEATDEAAAEPEPIRPSDAVLAAIELARAVALGMAGEDAVGEHQEVHPEDDGSATHYFAAEQPGYRGWRWAVTVADGGPGTPVTVSEAVLLPGVEALVAPAWVPWQERVRAGDLGVGDLLPVDPDDERLVPGYLASDDPEVRDVVREVGLGRLRVLSLFGRQEAAQRWHHGERGPRAEMAKAAPGVCGSCGFYLQLAGSLSAAFGVCANEMAPADGAVVHTGYGCGAHSDVEADQGSITPVAEVVFDDGVDLETR